MHLHASIPPPAPDAGTDVGALVAAAGADLARLQLLLDALPSPVVEHDADQRCVWANRAFLDLVGLSLDEVLGQGWHRTVHPDDLAVILATPDPVPTDGRISVRHLHTDGRVRSCESWVVPLPARPGARPGAIVSIHDVTETVERAAEELRRMQQFHHIFDSTSVGMAVTDLDGVVLDVNPAYCAALRIDREDLLGRRLHDVVTTGEGRFDFEGAAAALLSGDGYLATECLVRRLDMTSFWAQSSLSLARGEHDDPVVVAQILDVDAQHRQRTELRHRAEHDELTGLRNRSALLAELTARLTVREGLLAVLFCDLDRFKAVNDSLGHAAGDEVLVTVARRLLGGVRAGDVVARLGGDEFVVLLTGFEDPQVAVQTADRLAAELDTVMVVAGQEVRCGVSIGITVVDLSDDPAAESVAGLEATSLLRDADTAMYEAKGSGRGTHRVFSRSMRERVVARLEIENGLRAALDRRELVVHYQPVVRLRDGRRSGYEALVRWQHPERGLLLPGEFLEAAEDCGLSGAVDAFVLEEALDFLERRPGVHVAVNTSARRFDGTFATSVREGLAQRGVSPRRLVVELLETSLLAEDETTTKELRDLADMGVTVLIDDFGTGYSALSYLRRLPVSGLKLDRSFVADLPADTDSDRIAAAVVGLAESFGLQSVAEGVETAEQARHLRTQGWRYAQGWHFGRPAAEEHWYPAARPSSAGG